MPATEGHYQWFPEIGEGVEGAPPEREWVVEERAGLGDRVHPRPLTIGTILAFFAHSTARASFGRSADERTFTTLSPVANFSTRARASSAIRRLPVAVTGLPSLPAQSARDRNADSIRDCAASACNSPSGGSAMGSCGSAR